MIDNYDSFTYNLVQYFGELNCEVQVYRNDQITLTEMANLLPQYLVISPGPCTPNQAGISLSAIQAFAGKIPLLGVCLGHQSIGQAFGGKIIHAKYIMHGKTSMIYHTGRGLFQGIPNPFQATRYHSLVIDQATVPDCLEITAWTQTANGEIEEIMGVQHQDHLIIGVQFHPESILTHHGHTLLKNFLTMADFSQLTKPISNSSSELG
ncbi:MAG: aminodeoxychorismate/anthranilate synthase component II [Thioploca sp.]|nr:aminodeoxychorismate/anthranilate synthase component II [Thioploca sp.]